MAKKLSRSELEQKVIHLEYDIQQLKAEHASELKTAESNLETEKTAFRAQVKQVEDESLLLRESLESQISSLQAEMKETQDQLNERELKKLAEAYAEQEKEFKSEMGTWLRIVLVSLGLLLISIVISGLLAHEQPWYARFEYYFVNFVLVTFLIFSLKRYSGANRWRTDFANRKTIAQSYQNIISTTSDAVIQDKFLDRATDILCAPIDQKTDTYTLPEKLMDGVTEVAKNLSKRP